MPARFEIDDDVLAVLRKSVVTKDSVTLPAEQLDRKLYVRVNKVLEAAGGTWNRKAKAHLFARDPREVLALATDEGIATNVQQVLQAYYTPRELASAMAEQARIEPGDVVLEPNAGMGALAFAAARYALRPHITCYDIDQVAINHLRDNTFLATCQDFLTVCPGRKYDVILMNPPFTRGQDMQHILHALDFLADGGRMQAIASLGVTFGETKLHKQFREALVYYDANIDNLPDGTFKEAGTGVKAIKISIDLSN